MLKIAICDDEKVFRDNINKYVAAYLNEKEISYEIDTFSSGKEIIYIGCHKYNIYFRTIFPDFLCLNNSINIIHINIQKNDVVLFNFNS